MSEQTEHRLDFDEVADLLVQLSSHTSPSELHGFLCGVLAGGKRVDGEAFNGLLEEVLDVETVFSPEQSEKLRFIYMSSLNSLMDEQFGFYPLLADDDAEIEIRLTCLSQWCQLFLSGFATVEKAIKDIPEIVNDALNDMAAISQVGFDDEEFEDDDPEAVEDDYAQLVEYIRLASMNIFMEYIPRPAHEAAANAASAKSDEKAPDDAYLSAQDLFQQRKIH